MRDKEIGIRKGIRIFRNRLYQNKTILTVAKWDSGKKS